MYFKALARYYWRFTLDANFFFFFLHIKRWCAETIWGLCGKIWSPRRETDKINHLLDEKVGEDFTVIGGLDVIHRFERSFGHLAGARRQASSVSRFGRSVAQKCVWGAELSGSVSTADPFAAFDRRVSCCKSFCDKTTTQKEKRNVPFLSVFSTTWTRNQRLNN